jgi:hypothetical protein
MCMFSLAEKGKCTWKLNLLLWIAYICRHVNLHLRFQERGRTRLQWTPSRKSSLEVEIDICVYFAKYLVPIYYGHGLFIQFVRGSSIGLTLLYKYYTYTQLNRYGISKRPIIVGLVSYMSEWYDSLKYANLNIHFLLSYIHIFGFERHHGLLVDDIVGY